MKQGEDYKKDTTLDDSASIYQKREEKSEKQKLSEMNGKEKLTYFKDYYLKTVVIVACAAALVVAVLVSVLKHKPEQIMNVVITDNFLSDATLEKIKADFTEKFVTDTYEQEIFIDPDYYYSSDEYSSSIKFSTRLYAGEIDIIIARKSRMLQFCQNDIMEDLSSLYTADEFAKLKDRVLMARVAEEDPKTGELTYLDAQPLAFILDNFNNYNGYDLSADPLCVGICQTVQNRENGRAAADYLLNYVPGDIDYGPIASSFGAD